MVETSAIFVTYILFFFFGIVGLYYWNKRLNIKLLPEASVDPAIVVCSKSSVLEAWQFGYGQKPLCPAFTNNFVVAGQQRTLYEKTFITDTGTTCCYFSNDRTERTEVDFPWIIIGNVTRSSSYTLSELNDKIYRIGPDSQIIYYVPVCDGTPSCLGMVRVGLSELDGETVGLYKIYRFRGERFIEFVGTDPVDIPDDISTQIAINATIVIAAGGKTILKVVDDESEYCNQRKGELVCYLSQQPILEQLTTLSNDNGLAPIAGFNPVLSGGLGGSTAQ